MNIVYNGATSRTQIELTYDPKALNCWERFELDWEKFWSGTGGKVVAVTVFVAALVLAICCPQFAPILIATVVDIGLTVMLGGITGGLSSVANGSGFWDGAGSYVNDNIALTATTELILAMAAFGLSQAVTSVKSVQPVKASQAAESIDVPAPVIEPTYSAEFELWLNKGEANNTVYNAISKGTNKPVYTGITRQDLRVRLKQHQRQGKPFDRLESIYKGLTRNQARSVETYLIITGDANEFNKILSIKRKSRYFNEAMLWASRYIGG